MKGTGDVPPDTRGTETNSRKENCGIDSPGIGAGRKYPLFQLGREEFANRVLKVREIMGIRDITAVPRTPGHVKDRRRYTMKALSQNQDWAQKPGIPNVSGPVGEEEVEAALRRADVFSR